MCLKSTLAPNSIILHISMFCLVTDLDNRFMSFVVRIFGRREGADLPPPLPFESYLYQIFTLCLHRPDADHLVLVTSPLSPERRD